MDPELYSHNGHHGADPEVLAMISADRKSIPGVKTLLVWFAIIYVVAFYQLHDHFQSFFCAVVLIGIWGISIDIRKAEISRRWNSEMQTGLHRSTMHALNRLNNRLDRIEEAAAPRYQYRDDS